MAPKHKKQLQLIGSISKPKAIGGPSSDSISKFLKKDPKRKGLFSKGRD